MPMHRTKIHLHSNVGKYFCFISWFTLQITRNYACWTIKWFFVNLLDKEKKCSYVNVFHKNMHTSFHKCFCRSVILKCHLTWWLCDILYMCKLKLEPKNHIIIFAKKKIMKNPFTYFFVGLNFKWLSYDYRLKLIMLSNRYNLQWQLI